MIPERNKYGEEIGLFYCDLDGPSKKKKTSTRKNGVGEPFSTVGVKYQRGLKEYHKNKRKEFQDQHGPVRVIYSRPSGVEV